VTERKDQRKDQGSKEVGSNYSFPCTRKRKPLRDLVLIANILIHQVTRSTSSFIFQPPHPASPKASKRVLVLRQAPARKLPRP